MEVSAACSGWLYALTVAEGMMMSGVGETILGIAAEKMSAITDWTDRSTCVLFGDGAGAVVLKRSQGKSALGQLMPNWQSRLFVLTPGEC